MANGRAVGGASASANQNTFSKDAAPRFGARALLGAASRLTLAPLIGAGAAFFASPAFAANINVADSAQLISALTTAAAGDTITFTQNITLAAAMPQLTKDVTINGGGFQLNGANKFQGFAVLSGTVAINNLNVANTLAQGALEGGQPLPGRRRRRGGAWRRPVRGGIGQGHRDERQFQVRSGHRGHWANRVGLPRLLRRRGGRMFGNGGEPAGGAGGAGGGGNGGGTNGSAAQPGGFGGGGGGGWESSGGSGAVGGLAAGGAAPSDGRGDLPLEMVGGAAATEISSLAAAALASEALCLSSKAGP